MEWNYGIRTRKDLLSCTYSIPFYTIHKSEQNGSHHLITAFPSQGRQDIRETYLLDHTIYRQAHPTLDVLQAHFVVWLDATIEGLC